MSLPAPLDDLLKPAAYPHACGSIELIETHISWVLLTGPYAYKLKKPVEFGFLDFSTAELREHFCHEELRCNSAFAPDLYIAVVPVCKTTAGSVRIGGQCAADEELLEWAVQMRQFDPATQLDRLVAAGQVKPALLAAFGRSLAARYAQMPRLDETADIADRSIGPAQENFTEIAATGLGRRHAELATAVETRTAAISKSLLPLIRERAAAGFVRECHGDLHLSNLVLLDTGITAFDCLEFNPLLRWIDTMSDVAFLFMDCCERDRTDLAYAFLDGYLDTSADYRGVELLAYFAAYRSTVRAKVAALQWDQQADTVAAEHFVAHLEWARTWLQRPLGALVLMCGLSGAGKSWLAERLTPLLPAVRLRSDIARKALAGLDSRDNSASPVGGGLYTPEISAALFNWLAELAERLLNSGENVIIDASFIEARRRAPFLRLAEQLGIRVHIVYCTAPAEVLRERIQDRVATGADPSEATLAVLDAQLEKLEAPTPSPQVVEVRTDGELGQAELIALSQSLLS